jgi:hypothetical protein
MADMVGLDVSGMILEVSSTTIRRSRMATWCSILPHPLFACQRIKADLNKRYSMVFGGRRIRADRQHLLKTLQALKENLTQACDAPLAGQKRASHG